MFRGLPYLEHHEALSEEVPDAPAISVSSSAVLLISAITLTAVID